MTYFTAILIASSFFFSANGLFLPWLKPEAKWDSLKITYGPAGPIPIPIPGIGVADPFAKMPLNTKDAKRQGFQQLSEECSGDFQGYRYSQSKNPAVILLYDTTGHIAGIQTTYAESQMKTQKLKDWFKQHPMLTLETTDKGTFYTATAYFMNPDDICNAEGASKRVQGEIGINLYLKNGTENTLVPKKQSDLGNTRWTMGKCFPVMGLHYWYDTSKDMDCNYFQPFFMLYWEQKLAGFGFAVFGDFDSTRFEKPPSIVFPFFMKTVPQCMKDQSVSTMHVYFNGPLDRICLPSIF